MYRDRHSSGVSHWIYRPLYVDKITDDLKKDCEESMQEKSNEWNWSDHFRGIEWKIVDTRHVSMKAIAATLIGMKRSVNYHKIAIKDLNGQIPQILSLLDNGKGRKTDPDDIEQARRDKQRAKSMRDFQKRQAKGK